MVFFLVEFFFFLVEGFRNLDALPPCGVAVHKLVHRNLPVLLAKQRLEFRVKGALFLMGEAPLHWGDAVVPRS